jgi:HD-like signal output (HDOD) protein
MPATTGMDSGMIACTMADIKPFLQSVKLPVMPEVAHALIRTLNDDKADIATVSAVIARDPALTTTLLRIANSALFGLSRSVSTLDSAVSILGITQIRARALSICMANAFIFPQGIDRLAFWRSSMACAGYAKWLAHHCQLDEQQAWLAGMMLRLGELIIGQTSTHLLAQIERPPLIPGERWARERQLTGFDEGQVTAEIASRWDFPQVLVQGLEHSAQPMLGDTFEPLSGVLHLASLLADHAKNSPEVLDLLPADVVQALQLEVAKLKTRMPDANTFGDVTMLQN